MTLLHWPIDALVVSGLLRSWVTDAVVQISSDLGQTWSERQDAAMVTLAGADEGL